MPRSPRLFCFGLGYSARAFARDRRAAGWSVAGTAREAAAVARLRDTGVDAWVFDRDHPLPPGALDGTTHVLVSVPPDGQGGDGGGDPVLDLHGGDLAALADLAWVGYLSTTGVYGDTGGAVVDETAPLRPDVGRSQRRAAAEAAWLARVERDGLPVHVFRLAGIYGPGRSQLDAVRAGRARRIDRPGHCFSRIHVDDIAAVLAASVARPRPGAVYNVCDDEPVEPQQVTAFACNLLGVEPPPLVPFAEAARDMSPMARSFWADNRRVDNGLIKRELEVRLRYPDYRAGLRAVLAAEKAPEKVPGTF
ncbi:MAG: SDR family NAD(P)-dependent oxidoreductase [Hyphomicrobiales bacterium]|nr:SDR family NAD(P)-dependent oxidoreductase [Hyphomicrobiales bacterium]MCP5374164.1 SDR family NAD(P)-dependent oxidoreductase [Hyphomicrobiales bacterium]